MESATSITGSRNPRQVAACLPDASPALCHHRIAVAPAHGMLVTRRALSGPATSRPRSRFVWHFVACSPAIAAAAPSRSGISPTCHRAFPTAVAPLAPFPSYPLLVRMPALPPRPPLAGGLYPSPTCPASWMSQGRSEADDHGNSRLIAPAAAAAARSSAAGPRTTTSRIAAHTPRSAVAPAVAPAPPRASCAP